MRDPSSRYGCERRRFARQIADLDRSAVDLDSLRYDDRGLIPVIAQDADTGEVLMLAWANREALERTLSRGTHGVLVEVATGAVAQGRHERPWATLAAHVDCDADVIVARIHQEGAACHTGERSCFFRSLMPSEG